MAAAAAAGAAVLNICTPPPNRRRATSEMFYRAAVHCSDFVFCGDRVTTANEETVEGTQEVVEAIRPPEGTGDAHASTIGIAFVVLVDVVLSAPEYDMFCLCQR